ncbi:protein TonB [Rhodoferax ferrireducens]|uniref:Protein TonB n=1 Tax=Rhodoferax ferrireducens TaxID=192843 RepID=A0ABU2C2P3_9BURK|nr:energy transducer TonB [Rhodoferax ferrireducens]MDR7375512.1 protein TonB [Rhodoferax ferrireducens]
MNSTAPLSPSFSLPRFSRNAVIVSSVLVFHGLAIWALQSGLVRKAIEIVVPVEMLSEFIEVPQPRVAPPPPPPAPIKQPVVKTKAPTLPPAPQPLAIADPTPAPNAPTGVTTPQPPAPPTPAPVAAAPSTPPAALPIPTPAKAQTLTEADYLYMPPRTYPVMSRRLQEQGTVIVNLEVNANGIPVNAVVTTSSGFDRLDKNALAFFMKCRFVPYKVDGVGQSRLYYTSYVYLLDLD